MIGFVYPDFYFLQFFRFQADLYEHPKNIGNLSDYLLHLVRSIVCALMEKVETMLFTYVSYYPKQIGSSI